MTSLHFQPRRRLTEVVPIVSNFLLWDQILHFITDFFFYQYDGWYHAFGCLSTQTRLKKHIIKLVETPFLVCTNVAVVTGIISNG